MRQRIDKTIDIVNSQQEFANVLIKGNPFERTKTQTSDRNSNLIVEEVEEDSEQSESLSSENGEFLIPSL